VLNDAAAHDQWMSVFNPFVSNSIYYSLRMPLVLGYSWDGKSCKHVYKVVKLSIQPKTAAQAPSLMTRWTNKPNKTRYYRIQYNNNFGCSQCWQMAVEPGTPGYFALVHFSEIF